ncbi:hypothetical protein Hanom_Chr11g01042761 [Helianthus anomalus]
MASSKNDIQVQFSRLTQTEVDQFCVDHGSDPSLGVVAPGTRTANKCPKGHVMFYTRILDQPNLRYPFTNFFLEVLKYHRLSLGQLAPLCILFGRSFSFFRLARNGDWFTIEKTQCEAALIVRTVGHTYTWKDRFFFIYENLLPFAFVPRKFVDGLNEKEPDVADLE